MTQNANANDDSPPEGDSRGERTLRREDFCDEWIETIAARAVRLGNYPMLSKEERETSRMSFQREIAPGQDAFVFAYGSLMWNPAMHIAESRRGTVHGHHRVFCLSMLMGRGSPEAPGLMLALDRGGSCCGMVHRIAAEHVESEFKILWMREMLGGAYRPRWVRVRVGGANAAGEVRAVTFVANQTHPRYAGKLPAPLVADRIARASGNLGSNRHYLFRLAEHLIELGITDGGIHDLAREVRAQVAVS